MHSRNSKGSALVVVIIVMAVLTILGSSLLTVSLAESKHAIHQEKKTQAHYLARSGIEIGLNILDTALNNDNTKYIGDLEGLRNFLNTSVGNSGSTNRIYTVNDIGSFTIDFLIVNDAFLKICSTGTVNANPSVKSTVTLTMHINSSDDIINPTNWINPSGKIIINEIPESEGYPNHKVRLNGVKLPSNAQNKAVILKAAILLTDNLEIKKEENAILDAGVIYFNAPLSIAKKASVMFKCSDGIKDGNGFEDFEAYYSFLTKHIPLGELLKSKEEIKAEYVVRNYPFSSNAVYGVVYFKDENQYYFFPSGVIYDNYSSSLIPIDSDDPIIKAIEKIGTMYVETGSFVWDDK